MTKNKTKKKKNKSKKLIHFVLGFIAIVLAFLLTYYFVLPSVFSSTKETKNILLVSSDLSEQNSEIKLAHLSKDIDENMIVSIDGKQVINIDTYGEYSLNTIHQLLKIDGKSDQEIKSIFSNILKISIDDVVVENGGYKLGSGFSKNEINLLKLHFLDDTMEVFELNSVENLKSIYHRLSTLDENVYQNCSVSVVNTTVENGLAKKVSEMIENTGARVMQVEGSDQKAEKTTIYYPINTECGQLVDRILGIFPERVELKDFSELSLTQQFRSSVVVMIGSNY